jgi:hypothetical protein
VEWDDSSRWGGRQGARGERECRGRTAIEDMPQHQRKKQPFEALAGGGMGKERVEYGFQIFDCDRFSRPFQIRVVHRACLPVIL